ncbi:MAG: M48 family metallopeptidase [Candidatus Eremiobacteraeota bacterium]|nr:M48 family metallopeptidase [Candidatus Eremiobacteraeota bacterium]
MRKLLAGAAAGFVAAYVAVRTLEALADLRAPAPPLEKDPVRYGASRRALMLSGIVRSLATNAVLAFAVAERLPPNVRRNESLLGGALYYACATLVDAALETPIDYVERFVLERRYGLSDQKPADWLLDRTKSAALSIAIGTPLTTALMTLARRFPRTWPLLAAAAIPPLLVLANLLIPVYVAPVFNKFEPLRGSLESRLRALAARYGVGDAKILRFDLSRRSKKANAYVAGLFHTHRIVVADTLLEGFSEDEVEFVVAHELGHYVGRDTWIGVAAGTLAGGALIFGAHALARRREDPVVSIPGLQRFTFYLTLLAMFAGPLLAAGSRAIERRADRFAVRATERPSSGIAAFERLRERNLAEDEEPRWAELLFSSHPSLKSRIAALRLQ